MFDGHVICGGWVSLTVTVKLQIALGATPFEAVHVTVVVPFGNAVPEVTVVLFWSLQVMDGAGQPVELVENATTAVHRFGSAFTLKFAGQVMVGGSLTLCEAPVEVLPL